MDGQLNLSLASASIEGHGSVTSFNKILTERPTEQPTNRDGFEGSLGSYTSSNLDWIAAIISEWPLNVFSKNNLNRT